MFLNRMSRMSVHAPWLHAHAEHAIKEHRDIVSGYPNPIDATNHTEPETKLIGRPAMTR